MKIDRLNLFVGADYQFEYENHRGETYMRTVQFLDIQYGENEWYPVPQFFFFGFDREKQAPRSFALAKIDMTTFRKVGP